MKAAPQARQLEALEFREFLERQLAPDNVRVKMAESTSHLSGNTVNNVR